MSYKENPEVRIDMVERLFDRFKNTKLVMPQTQREFYQELAPYCLGRIVFDVGCGLGIGTNILAQKARFVWGLDLEENHIEFARGMFGSEHVRFDQYDLLNATPRELSKAHIVVLSEVIEHVADYQGLLDGLKRFMDERTTGFITTPNRNADEIQKDTPRNPHHVREWGAAEFYDVMIKNFKSVTLYGHDLKETVDLDSKRTPIVAKVEGLL
jgi:2-polyprenyl-3-methyl-5-hydroxy-6-metoxy-1,4-benzoquinol methylase